MISFPFVLLVYYLITRTIFFIYLLLLQEKTENKSNLYLHSLIPLTGGILILATILLQGILTITDILDE